MVTNEKVLERISEKKLYGIVPRKEEMSGLDTS